MSICADPTIHKYFDFEPEYGLLDYLKGEAELEDLFVNPVLQAPGIVTGTWYHH